MNDKGEIPIGEKSATAVVGQSGQSAQGEGDACQNSIVRWGISDIYPVISVNKLTFCLFR